MSSTIRLDIPILQVKDARTGESVGYGATQVLARDSRLAILAVGYADGFFRALSSTQQRGALLFGVETRHITRLPRKRCDLVVFGDEDTSTFGVVKILKVTVVDEIFSGTTSIRPKGITASRLCRRRLCCRFRLSGLLRAGYSRSW